MSTLGVLPNGFYSRSPKVVARELLGKILVRLIDGKRLVGNVVETEAYYGEEDPASRAYKGKKFYNSAMWGEPGRLFVYNVHKYWMLNVVAHLSRDVGGVLFRAIEPVAGVEEMMRRRQVNSLRELTSGPGKLSIALGVSSELNGLPVTDADCPVHFLNASPVSAFITSHRIGVTRDLPEELRFYIDGNRFVSRRVGTMMLKKETNNSPK